MKNVTKLWTLAAMRRSGKVVISVLLFILCVSFPAEAAVLKALVMTGQSNQYHNWKVSSPIFKQLLEQTGLFTVDVAISPDHGGDMANFKPNFAGYDVVVIDYEGDSWSEQTKQSFVEYVKSGGGVIIYHASSNAFGDWKQFNEIAGLGGWGGRDEKSGPYICWQDGRIVRDTSPGPGGTHGPQHAFQVVNRNKTHPVTKGLPEKWMHAKDELYSLLRGPAENLTVLSTAYADPTKKGGTGRHEPILFTVNYGKGRVFHTVLGHVGPKDVPPIQTMDCVGFIVTFQRGAEWAATGNVTQKVPEDFPTATEVRIRKGCKPMSLDELLDKIASYEFGQSRESLTELTDIVRESYKSAQQRKDIEERFLKFLRSDATLASKQFICRKLSLIGTEESVPTLTMMLTEPTTSDMARYALERIPASSVDEALRKALPKTTGKTKVGIINTLGARGDYKSVAALSSLIYDSDPTIAAAAAGALGRIAGPQATEALAEAKDKTSGKLRLLVLDAYINCADQLVARGKQTQALAIYKQLYASGEPTPIRSAALKGMVAATPEKAFAIVIDALKARDQAIQAVAIGLVREIPGTKIIKAAAAELPNLPVAGQVQLLSALGDHGDRAGLQAVVKAAKSPKQTVRIAALKALGKLGNASTVDLLVQVAASGKGAERAAARNSLYRLRGSEVDQAILASIPQAKAKVKVELIRSTGKRNVSEAVGTLFKTAQDSDGNVRLESIKVLSDIAEPKHMPTLIRLLINAKTETELKQAEKTLAFVSRKSVGEDNGTAAVLDALASVGDIKVRCSLLRVLGAIASSKALGVLREALEDNNAEIQLAATRALSDWPNAEPAADLQKVASSTDDEKQRALALRGFIRLIGLDSNRPPEETMKMYQEAMSLASNASEKKMVLSQLANVKSFAALYMASDYLKDDALQQEAGAAMVKIAESTRNTHPQQTRILLRVIIQVSKSDSLRQKAQELINKIK